jgi:DNA-binding transcriptional LysR family regulator
MRRKRRRAPAASLARVAPVAHPSLGVERLDAAAVSSQFLIEYDDPNRPWLQWADRLQSAGLGAVKPKGVLRFNQYDQAIQAALAGQGIALGRMALIGGLIAERRLVAIGGADSQSAQGFAYWLIQAEANPQDDVQTVIDWIEAEAENVESRSGDKASDALASGDASLFYDKSRPSPRRGGGWDDDQQTSAG